MSVQVFLGEPPATIKQWIIEHYVKPQTPTEFKVVTTSDYKKTGIYSATRDDTGKPVEIDWGDGTKEQVDGDVSRKTHEYATAGTFTVTIGNVKAIAANSGDYIWEETVSQNQYTLKEVKIGSRVTSIGYFAFAYCVGLVNVAIPDSVTSIDEGAFQNCIGLASVTIPDSVTSIGGGAFAGCSDLTSMIFQGKTLAEVQGMANYPWGISDTSFIKAG